MSGHWARLSVPSKAFILGEYAVLKGAPALVATFAPRFELSKSGEGTPLAKIHEASPVRRLIEAHRGSELLSAHYRDPHQGSGGFGGSTAEFALAYAALNGTGASVSKLWEEYLQIQPQASGADLAAQWTGGVLVADPVGKSVEKIHGEKLFRNFFVFSAAHQAGRKVKTHEHLELLKRADLAQLARSEVLANGIDSARRGDFEEFARSVNEYARLLRAMGLELSQTTEDRAALRDVPGVCAVKGTGAMQADALVVFGNPEVNHAELSQKLTAVAQSRNLRLVSKGWKEESGISS